MTSSPATEQRKKNLSFMKTFSITVSLVFLIAVMNISLQIYGIKTISNDPNIQPTKDSFNLANEQSFGFFNDISNENWQKLQEIVAVHYNHKYMEKPLTHNPAYDKRRMKYFNSHPAWWQTNFEPNFSCQFERRIGFPNGNGDGPKWICDPHRIKRLAQERKAKNATHPGCVVYSIGSNGDFSFEAGLEEEVGPGVCEFHIFDMKNYTDKMLQYNISRAHFHQWGLKKQDWDADIKPNQTFYGMRDTMQLLGHEGLDVIDIFKIDCESCEWSTFKDWLGEGIPALMQIQVELHKAKPEAIELFEFLEEQGGYVRFHKEPNIQFNDGSCIEYALLKLDQDFFEPRKKMIIERNLTRKD